MADIGNRNGRGIRAGRGRAAWPALLVAAACSTVAGLGCGQRQMASSVLLITIDTLRPDHLSAYGYPRRTSPALDRIAASGLLFEIARSQAPETAPAHASILTGRLPSWHQVRTNGDILNENLVTLAERLAAAGFRTAAFVSNPTISSIVNFDQGFQHYDDTLPQREAYRPQTERIAAATVDAALGWLEAHHNERFFCWVHLQDPHGPYTPPQEHAAAFLREARALPREDLTPLGDQSGRGGIPKYQAIPGERNRQAYVARYDGEIHYADAELDHLFKRLSGWGVEPLVVITADHGEALGEHGYYFAHGHALTEDQIRVPLILAGPGVPAGTRSVQPAEHRDILPTVLRSVGLPVPTELTGRDLLAPGTTPGPAVAQALPDRWSITSGRSKLLAGGGRAAVYDLAADPGELRDIRAQAVRKTAHLQAILHAARSAPPPPWERVSARGAILLQQLQALGYLDPNAPRAGSPPRP